MPLLAASLFSILPLSAVAERPTVAVVETSISSSSLTSSFGDALNQFRASEGLGGLREDPHLSRAAQAYAEDMAQYRYFDHTGRDGSNVVTRVRAGGCRGARYYAENIAWGQHTAQAAFSGWAASPGHRANMLGRNYGAFGLGQAAGYWVLVFTDGC
jgi:uncharacterized protein YkwD